MSATTTNTHPMSGTKEVEERHRIDTIAVERWMRARIREFQGPITITQFKGGQSNPTYKIETPGESYVLRRKPFGRLLPSAHAVDREFRIISALHSQGFPVPRPYGLCLEENVIGASFYVMQMVDGRNFWDGSLLDMDASERSVIYKNMILTLARLHNLNPALVGLGDYGKPGNYFARQIDRWTRQYRASETARIEPMDRLIEYLPRSIPEQTSISIVHGDYRLDNMIFANDAPAVIAVLDWELSTLGDPMADLSGLLAKWISPIDGRSGLLGLDLAALGIPTLEEAFALYRDATGISSRAPLEWYFSFSFFRIAAILQGVAGRVRDGTSISSQGLSAGTRAISAAILGWEQALRAQSKAPIRAVN